MQKTLYFSSVLIPGALKNRVLVINNMDPGTA